MDITKNFRRTLLALLIAAMMLCLTPQAALAEEQVPVQTADQAALAEEQVPVQMADQAALAEEQVPVQTADQAALAEEQVPVQTADQTAQAEGQVSDQAAVQVQSVETEISHISSHSSSTSTSVYFEMTPEEYAAAGYQAGDMVRITIADCEPMVVPYAAGYSLGYREEGLRTRRSELALSLVDDHAADFAADMKVTIEMVSQGTYIEVLKARDIGRMTYKREDYPADMSEEAYANFREVTTTGMGRGILYRSSNPVNPMIGRNTYSDSLIRKAGVTTILNLSDKPESVSDYKGYDQSYYSTVNHIEVNMGGGYGGADFNAKLTEGFRFMIEHPGVFEVNCIFGRDRTGFVIAVLEGLMGATYDEICDDYVETYRNYNQEYGNYEPIEYRDQVMAESNIVPQLEYAYGIDDLKTADISAATEEYLKKAGMTELEIRRLRNCLAPAKRTVMLYACGADLEAGFGLASFNLQQVLASNFSADDDVRFIVMTGGANYWFLDSKYLCDPYGVGISADDESGDYYIDNRYNQLWEARGQDSPDAGNAGRLALLDKDGFKNAPAQPKMNKDGSVTNEGELMTDPETLKNFINYCTKYAPADKYDLILWDHGGGPYGGFGSDQHQKNSNMTIAQVADALSHNLVTDSNSDGKTDGRFDLVDFDACLMNTVELNLLLSDYMDYYIASAETEPGYGQCYGPHTDGKYNGWVDVIGADPEIDTYELGKVIVDDFYEFYEHGENMEGQEGTLAVVDARKLAGSGLVEALADMNDLLRDEAVTPDAGNTYLFYDELSAARQSLRYAADGTYDLGSLAGLLAVTSQEINGSGYTNRYLDVSKRIQKILSDKSMIYGRCTSGIISDAAFRIDAEGRLQLSGSASSGMYIFFPPTSSPSYSLSYCERMTEALKTMQSSPARSFLSSYIVTAADYALIETTGQAAGKMINAGTPKSNVCYSTAKEYWMNRKSKSDDPSYWESYVAPLIDVRGGEAGAAAWMDGLLRQQAAEAVSGDNAISYGVRSRKGDGTRIVLGDTGKRAVCSVDMNITADLPYTTEYLKNSAALGSMYKAHPEEFEMNLGRIEAQQDVSDLNFDLSHPEKFYDEYMEWYNKPESAWEFAPSEDKWYALRDADGNNHAAQITDNEDSGKDVIITYGEPDEVDPSVATLTFNGSGKLTKITLGEGSASRAIRPEELKVTLDRARTAGVVYIMGMIPAYFPVTAESFDITPENVTSIRLDYTRVENIPDIAAVNKTYTVRDIYSNDVDITGQVEAKAGGELISIADAEVGSAVYNGKAQEPVVSYGGEVLTEGTDYTLIKLTDENEIKNAGTYYVTLHGKGRFTGVDMKAFVITKAANTLQAKGKTAGLKYSRLKNKVQKLSVSRVIRLTDKGQGARTYTLSSAKQGKKNCRKYFTVNKKTGKITVKKGLSRGTYKVKIRVRAAGNANYKASGKVVTATIKVK